MQREVFILPGGESFFAWDIHFATAKQRKESQPCYHHYDDGSVRKGVLHYTIESAEVSFRTYAGSVRIGIQGQLSTADEVFYEVTISSLKPAGDQILVWGMATRKIYGGWDR